MLKPSKDRNWMLIAIDPSLRSSGVSVFLNGKVFDTKKVVTSKKVKGIEALFYQKMEIEKILHMYFISSPSFEFYLVIEEQEHRGENEEMSLPDFVLLASLSYAIYPSVFISTLVPSLHIQMYKPREWKRSMPKEVHHPRIQARELALGTNLELLKGGQSDVVDSIGLGRFFIDNVFGKKYNG